MTITLAVILLECSGAYQIALPLMVTLVTARFVGNLFNESNVDTALHLRRWPVLEELARQPEGVVTALQVRDVMVEDAVCLREVRETCVCEGWVGGWGVGVGVCAMPPQPVP
jgi:chloride channel 7